MCIGRLKKGYRNISEHVGDVHHVNPNCYVKNILVRDHVFKAVKSDDPAETGNSLVLGALNNEEFRMLKDAMLEDNSKIGQYARAKYNMMIEKRNEEKCKVGKELITFYAAQASLPEGEILTIKAQEEEQRSLVIWAGNLLKEVSLGIMDNMLLGHEQPAKGIMDHGRDRENLLSLAKELVEGDKSGKETTIEEKEFWYKCKLCIYKGTVGDLYNGSELFGKHIAMHHQISISFYVDRFLKYQEVFKEYSCEANAGMEWIEPVTINEENQ
jgi:hypothetical protein